MGELVREYSDGLTVFLNSFTNNLSEAEELMEETFFRLAYKKPRYNGKSSFKTWLYSIARNLAIDSLRKRKGYKSVSFDDCTELTSEINVEEAYLKEERKAIIHRAISNLKDEYRQVVHLIYCAKNSTYQSADGNFYDWIELYNNGSQETNISGWGLSDKEDKPYLYTFPEGTAIKAGERLIVFCDSDAAANDSKIAPFGLSTSGETLVLTDAQGNKTHTITFGSIAEDSSYGQYPDGSGEFYTLKCTPAQANTAPEGSNAVHQPAFSQESGFYDNSFSLTLTADDGCTIYYTTDGSDPTPESEKYSEPITVEDMSDTQNRLSARTDIVPGKAEAPRNNVDKAAVIRAVSVDSEGRISDIVTKTYFIGKTNTGYYPNMKVVSLVTDPDNLFGYENGIYCLGQAYGGTQQPDDKPKEEEHPKEEEKPKEENGPEHKEPEDNRVSRQRAGNPWEMPANYTMRGREWEREASFTLFDNGEKVIEQNVGIRIKGNYSRSLPQKSFTVYTREDYGTPEFDYDFFSGKATKEQSLLFRYAGQ